MSESAQAPAPPASRPEVPEAALRRLEWTVVRRLDGLLHGDYRTLFRGGGVDLADLREYQHHDDVRHIDWNVTARLQTPYVREYTEDRELNAWFLLDVSPSVRFGSARLEKVNVASEFVTVLAHLLSRRGNRVGALFYGDRLDTVIPPRNGRRHVLHVLHRMRNAPPPQPAAQTDLNAFLQSALPLLRRRSLVFVVSDFISASSRSSSVASSRASTPARWKATRNSASRRSAAAAKRLRKRRSWVSTNNCSPVSASCITTRPRSGSSISSGS